MIIITGTDGTNNIIQLVLGPQSDLQLGSTKFIPLDLDEIIKEFEDQFLPVKLTITRTNNEVDLAIRLENGKKNVKYTSTGVPGVEKTLDSKDTARTFRIDFTCPYCDTKGVWVENRMPTMCEGCLAIEEGLARRKIKDAKTSGI